MDPQALTTVGLFVREMRSNRRRIDFVGLTNTLLTESHVFDLAGVLESQAPRPLTSMPRPKLEINQTTLSAPVRERLIAAGNKAGIHVILSAPSGPASRWSSPSGPASRF